MQRKVFVNLLLLNGDKMKLLNLKEILASFIEYKMSMLKFILSFRFSKLLKERSQCVLELWCIINSDTVLEILKRCDTKQDIYNAFEALKID